MAETNADNLRSLNSIPSSARPLAVWWSPQSCERRAATSSTPTKTAQTAAIATVAVLHLEGTPATLAQRAGLGPGSGMGAGAQTPAAKAKSATSLGQA